jgi:hypothetical protein
MLPYFKILTADNLEAISQEIYANLHIVDPNLNQCIVKNILRYDSLVDRDSITPNEDLTNIMNQFPLLLNWLESKGINRSNIVTIVRFFIPGNSKMNIHIDGNGEMIRQGWTGEAINIPVYNCQDSYTAWFDAEPYFLSEDEAIEMLGPKHLETYGQDTHNSRLRSFQKGLAFKEDTAKELARVRLNSAIWYNIKIPHQGINLNNGARIMLSLRFNKKLDVNNL